MLLSLDKDQPERQEWYVLKIPVARSHFLRRSVMPSWLAWPIVAV